MPRSQVHPAIKHESVLLKVDVNMNIRQITSELNFVCCEASTNSVPQRSHWSWRICPSFMLIRRS